MEPSIWWDIQDWRKDLSTEIATYSKAEFSRHLSIIVGDPPMTNEYSFLFSSSSFKSTDKQFSQVPRIEHGLSTFPNNMTVVTVLAHKLLALRSFSPIPSNGSPVLLNRYIPARPCKIYQGTTRHKQSFNSPRTVNLIEHCCRYRFSVPL